MAIALKLIVKEVEEKKVQVLKLIQTENNKEVTLKSVLSTGITLDETTFSRLQTLVTLGQRYEEIIKSQKSEFTDI